MSSSWLGTSAPAGMLRAGILGAAPRTGADPVPRAVCSRKTQLWCCCLVHGEAHHVLSSLCCPQLAVTLGAGTWGWGSGTVPCIPGNGAKGSTSFLLMQACVGSPQTPLTPCCHTDWGKRTHLGEISLCKEGPRRKKTLHQSSSPCPLPLPRSSTHSSGLPCASSLLQESSCSPLHRLPLPRMLPPSLCTNCTPTAMAGPEWRDRSDGHGSCPRQ